MRSPAARMGLLALAAPLLLAQTSQPTAPATSTTRPNPDARPLPIDWARAQADRRAAIQKDRPPQLERMTPQQLDAAHLPVLLPDIAEMRASGLVFPQPHSYAATVNLPGAMIEVFGSSRAASLAPATEKDLRSNMKPSAAGYLIGDSEYGQELSVSRYGAAYSIVITCTAPQKDDRCTKPDFLIGLADQMAMFGGTPEPTP